MITKPIKNTHNNPRMITRILNLGEIFNNSLPSEATGVLVTETCIGVIVAIEVIVAAGNINVNAGKGSSVVVGVTVGVVEGVNVCEGVLNVPVGDGELVLAVADSVTR
jgi:hypothetical protein